MPVFPQLLRAVTETGFCSPPSCKLCGDGYGSLGGKCLRLFQSSKLISNTF